MRAEIAAIRKSTITNPAAFDRMLQEYADIHYRQSQYAEAEPLYRELIDRRTTRRGAEHEEVLSATASLARLLADWAWSERGSEIRNQKSEIAQRAQEGRTPVAELSDTPAARHQSDALAHRRDPQPSRSMPLGFGARLFSLSPCKSRRGAGLRRVFCAMFAQERGPHRIE